jgi:hypothetical protein
MGIFHGFPQSLEGTAKVVPEIGHLCFLSYSLKLFTKLPAV